VERERIDGTEVRNIVEASASKEDLAIRKEAAGMVLL
jgi:hypothetical protein